MYDENALISINKCIGFFSNILFGPLITKKKKKNTIAKKKKITKKKKMENRWRWGEEKEAKKEYDLVLGMKVISIN